MRKGLWVSYALAAVVALGALYVGTRPGAPTDPIDRAHNLAETIKCPTCRGQAVAQSDAPASAGIREEITKRIDSGQRFQVKRIMVKPGARLSLQMHHHRAEHWVVVSGTAEVTNGTSVSMLSENQSTYIPLGQTHRLANPGKVPLEIIEVQSGSYLGEDDIVRFEDRYGREGTTK